MTIYITAIIWAFSGIISLASVIKLASMETIVAVASFGKNSSDELFIQQLRIMFVQWMPEFIHLVLPALGTASYFLTIN